MGGRWGDDGSIVASFGVGVGLSRIPAEGGEPVPLTTVNRDKGEFAHRWPQVVPSSRPSCLLYTPGAQSRQLRHRCGPLHCDRRHLRGGQTECGLKNDCWIWGSPPALTFDLAPDSKRFAVVLYADGTTEEKPITHVTFLRNLFDELRRRVPPP